MPPRLRAATRPARAKGIPPQRHSESGTRRQRRQPQPSPSAAQPAARPGPSGPSQARPRPAQRGAEARRRPLLPAAGQAAAPPTGAGAGSRGRGAARSASAAPGTHRFLRQSLRGPRRCPAPRWPPGGLRVPEPNMAPTGKAPLRPAAVTGACWRHSRTQDGRRRPGSRQQPSARTKDGRR